MAFTRVWTDNVPGSSLANTIDTLIGNVRVDVRERFLALFTNITADPPIIKPEILGFKQGKMMLIPGFAFQAESGLTLNSAGSISLTSGAEPARAPVILPNGITIKEIKWRLGNGDTAVITAKLRSCGFSSGALPQDDNSQTKATTGDEVITSGALSITPVSTRYYWLEVDKSGGAAFDVFACMIIYDATDARNTL